VNKIPTLFVRDFAGGHPERLTREVHPDCGWVIAGEGVATRKYDGTCVRLEVDPRGEPIHWWARREVKPSGTPPPGWQETSTDPETGKRIGWEPVHLGHAFANHLFDAVDHSNASEPQRVWSEGTYELCGPKINGNPEQYNRHVLIRHADAGTLDGIPRDYDGLALVLTGQQLFGGPFPYEGIVWHHPDGRMAKIKRRDFRA
jgi:hypothetical protein